MAKKIIFEEFIKRAKEVHGDKYDYSEVEIINSKAKIKIRCIKHNHIFEQVLGHHLRGSGCLLCARNVKPTTEEFIRRAIKLHGDKYDYSEVDYKNSQTKVPIICLKHGIFYQTPNNHLLGKGCKKCESESRALTTEEFVRKAKEVHGDFYGYSLTDYANSYTKVKIICPIHGVFEQKPNAHLNGRGCLKCKIANQTFTIEKFIEKAREVHGDKFDYSLIKELATLQSKVPIICQTHGVFEQRANAHLGGAGCSKCAVDKITFTKEEFIENAREVHGDKYDYSESDYINSQTKIYIGCPEHGIFQQFPNIHLRGWGCPECIESRVTSKGEKELCQYIKSVYSGKVLENTRKFIGRKELDIYLPELKLAFEYNGNYWHALYEEKDPGYHDHKRQLCKDAGITLIEVWENDWKKESDKIKKEISNIIKSKAIV